MNYQNLYKQPPTPDEFAARCTQVAELEAQVIDYILEQYGVGAGVNPRTSLITRQFFAFALDLFPGERKSKVGDVLALQREIALALSNLRCTPIHLRAQEMPLLLEVPNPWPQPIGWDEAETDLSPHRMTVGRAYDVYRGKCQLSVDFTRNQHHVLVAGSSGAGKSVLLNMMLLSLANNNSPADVRLLLCDLKGQDLPAFHRLPHVEAVATTVAEAERMIGVAHAEVQRRTQRTDAHHPRIVVVVDEQAELRNSKVAVDMQNSILALGRGLNVNMVLSTQDPTKETLGGLSTRNISVKLVGNVENADAARYATGRPHTGAQFLPRGGAFLYIDGPETQRFQAYMVTPADVAGAVAGLRRCWAGATGQRLPQPVNGSYNHLPPVVTSGGDRQNGANLAQNGVPAATGGDNQSTVTFPIGEGRALTEAERKAVRVLAASGDFDWRGQLSLSALVRHVYGSKDEARMGWIKEALTAVEPDSGKVIHLPRRVAAR